MQWQIKVNIIGNNKLTLMCRVNSRVRMNVVIVCY